MGAPLVVPDEDLPPKVIMGAPSVFCAAECEGAQYSMRIVGWATFMGAVVVCEGTCPFTSRDI
jgi:hypothetical protein